VRLLLLLSFGCVSSRALGRESLACSVQAERLSQVGRGDDAWHSQQCAASREVSAQLTRYKHTSWWWYDVTLQ
jgi:hypothetical protein